MLYYEPFKLVLPEELAFCDSRNINWSKVPMEHGNAAQINKTIDVLEHYGFKRVYPKPGKKLVTSLDEMKNAYFIDFSWKNQTILYWYEKWDEDACPHKMSTSADNIVEKTEGVTGTDAFFKINNYFRKISKKGLKQAYGTIEPQKKFNGKNLKKIIKNCVPIPVNYGLSCPVPIEHVYKIDISSAYSYEMTKTLPVMHDYKMMSGRVSPTEERPFAFYLKSHHLAIFNEFDTREFFEYKDWFDCEMKYVDVPDHEEVTILCKAASSELQDAMKDTMEYFYVNRKISEDYKKYMICAIGYFQKSNDPDLAHLTAVVQARNNMRVLKTAAEIQDRSDDNVVILINTDSIAWTGQKEPDFYVEKKEKNMGKFVLEHEDITALIQGKKRYQLKDGEQEFTIWAGVSKEKTAKMQFGEILTSKEAPFAIKWDQKSGRLIECTVNEEGDIIKEGGIYYGEDKRS